MMRRATTAILALAMVLTLLPATPVLAAEAGAPDIALQLWPEGDPGRFIVIVSASAPEGQTLPSTVDLPLIEGAEVLWAGEIMGSDPNQDVSQTPNVVDGPSGKVVRIAYTKGQSVQYEATIPGMTVSGNSVTASVNWLQTAASSKTSFAVRLPAGATDVSIRPASAVEPQRNSAGESLYTLPDRSLGIGDEVTVDIAYTKGGVVNTGSSGQGSSIVDDLPWILGVAVLVLAAAALALHARSKSNIQQ